MNRSSKYNPDIRHEVWAQLLLSEPDRERLCQFLIQEFGIKPRYVVRKMHLTIYHARRPMPELVPTIEHVKIILPATETRCMVMAPGGENPRQNIHPAHRKVGIRVHRQSAAMPEIISLREQLIEHETPQILGKRTRSTNKTNAFGARHYQPHMTLIRPGNGIHHDLTRIGIPFREIIGDLTFDRFQIDVIQKNIKK